MQAVPLPSYLPQLAGGCDTLGYESLCVQSVCVCVCIYTARVITNTIYEFLWLSRELATIVIATMSVPSHMHVHNTSAQGLEYCMYHKY